MKIERPVKAETEEEDVLPEDGAIENSRERDLELELARKEGELDGLRKSSPSQPAGLSFEQTKTMVFQDSNNLSDEDFKKKYNLTKNAATMSVMDQEAKLTKTEAKQMRAEITAEQQLVAMYGNDYYKFKDRILDSVADLSDAAKEDPKRLRRAMENAFLTESSKVKGKKTDPSRKQILPDFEKPSPTPDPLNPPPPAAEWDENIPTGADISDAKLARAFNLNSKEDAKIPAGDFVPMNMGGGIVFRNPSKGFEKVAPKA